MDTDGLTLIVHDELYSVARLGPGDQIPNWLSTKAAGLTVAARTARELSITCRQELVPEDVLAERGWRLFEVLGPLDFDQVGILAGLLAPLARASVPVFVVSTYETDFILIKEGNVESAISILQSSGHRVEMSEDRI